jgi:hypothetical protein
MGKILALTELIVGVFAPGRTVPELRLSMLLSMNMHRYDKALAEKVIRLVRPQQDATNGSLPLMADPVSSLLAIDDALAAWPAGLMERSGLPEQARENLRAVSAQLLQLHRTLAAVGVAPEQLVQLGNDKLDKILQTELTLMVGEAAWQLRNLARQARRQWHAEPGIDLPGELQQWLDRVIRTLW